MVLSEISSAEKVWYSQKLESSVDAKSEYGYDVLAEVKILQTDGLFRDSEGEWHVDVMALGYVRENELTAACEAVSDEGNLWADCRRWNGEEFEAFGTPFSDLLERGIVAAYQDINGDEQDDRAFEWRRRVIEAQTEKKITQAYKSGEIVQGVWMTISPYPEEISQELTQEYGYKSDERLAKLRFEVFGNSQRTTVEVSVMNSDVFRFKDFLGMYGVDIDDIHNSEGVLQQFVQVSSLEDESYLDVVTNTLAQYDSILETELGGNYYCGRLVDEPADYSQMVERRSWVLDQGAQLVDRLVQMDLLIAQSLENGLIHHDLAGLGYYWLNAQKLNGDYILSASDRSLILESLQLCRLNEASAALLKKNEMVRVWSAMACVLNEDRAEMLFGSDMVALIQEQLSQGSINDGVWQQMDYALANVDMEALFVLCGGSIGGYGGNLFSASLGEVKGALFGDSDLYVWVCDNCGHRHDIDVPAGHYKDFCEGCGASGHC